MKIFANLPIKRLCLSHSLIFFLVLSVFGQTANATSEAFPLKPLDTSSPRATMRVFMDYMNRAYQEGLVQGAKDKEAVAFLNRAAECLDLSQIAPNIVQSVGIETALLLKEVLDRIDLPPNKEIPNKITAGSGRSKSWTVPNTAIRIVMVERGPRKGEFLFSAATVERMREFYDRVVHLPYKPGSSIGAYEDYIFAPGPMIPQSLIRNLPTWTHRGIYDQAIWQWLGLFISLFIAGVVVVLLFRWSWPRKTDAEKSEEEVIVSRWSLRRLIFPLIWMLVALMTEYFVDEQINITGTTLKVIKICLRTLFFLACGWTILAIGNGIAHSIITSKRFIAGNIDANLIRLIMRLATLVLLCVLLWNTSDYLGVSLTAVFASAGIVGLGVALAARETLANFFGGVSIFLDRPFKSGDYIVLDSGERGQVVEVGLRSTRLLTRDDIQISIPNSLMTNTKIINESAPERQFRVRIKIGVAYGTNVDRVEEILLSVARKNSMVKFVPEPRVRFRSFGDSSLDFELLCWARRPDDRGRLIHELNNQIYKAFDAAGIQIPFPQHDVHLRADPDQLQ